MSKVKILHSLELLSEGGKGNCYTVSSGAEHWAARSAIGGVVREQAAWAAIPAPADSPCTYSAGFPLL